MLDVRNARALLAERVSPAFIASCYDPLPSPRAVESHRDELRLRAETALRGNVGLPAHLRHSRSRFATVALRRFRPSAAPK